MGDEKSSFGGVGTGEVGCTRGIVECWDQEHFANKQGMGIFLIKGCGYKESSFQHNREVGSWDILEFWIQEYSATEHGIFPEVERRRNLHSMMTGK